MKQLQTILCPTDLSACCESAVAWAVRLAEIHDATVHLFHATVLHQEEPHDAAFYLPDPEVAVERAREAVEETLAAQMTNHATEPSRVVTAHRRAFSAPAAILDYAADIDADLIVLGTHGRSAIGRFFLGSVASDVVRHAHCPVITTREGDAGRCLRAGDRIVVPMDFSRRAEEGLHVAHDLALQFDARLELVHVIDQPVWAEVYGFGGSYDLLTKTNELTGRCERALREVADEAKLDVPFAVHVLVGRAAHEIVEFAEGAGLVVIPSQGLTGLARLLIGSTAAEVVRTCRAPVMVLKSQPAE